MNNTRENTRIKKPGTLLEGVPNLSAGANLERDQKLIKDAIDEFVKVLDPIMNRMGQAISELQGRLTQAEEIINGALVEILTERVAKKLGLKNPTYADTHQYKNEPVAVSSDDVMGKGLPTRAKEEKDEPKSTS